MTNKTITGLTAASTLDGSELASIVQGGNSRKATLAAMALLGMAGDADKNYRVVSAVLRQSTEAGGWFAIDDSAHAPIGLDATTPVEESGGSIQLNYDFTSSKIGALIVGMDETYAATRLSCGASVGSTSALIDLYHPFWARISGTAAVSHSYFGDMATDNTLADGEWHAAYDVGAGTWTFTHGTESHSSSYGSCPIVNKAWDISAQTKSNFTASKGSALVGGDNVVFERGGLIKLNPANVYSGGGNLWVLGVFEV